MNVNAIVSSTPRSTAGVPPTPQDAGRGDSFANLLDREQATPPDAAADPDETAPSPDSAQAADRSAAQRGAHNPKAAARPGERPHARMPARIPGDADHETETDPAQAKNAAVARPDAAPTDPALLHWLQGLNLPTPPAGGTPEAGRTACAADTALQADACDGSELAPLTPQAGGAAASRAAGRDHRADVAGDRAASARDLQALRGEAVAQAETARAVEAAAPRFQDTLAALRAPSAEAAAAGAAATPGAATNAAATDPAMQAAQATLPVPLDDPQFPRAFGVQVSVFAREGVQQAELHLNPAEMGPVSIQIVMEGTQARIDFGADAAPTRTLIEQSLPELAAALREAGLTLAGGGVSQHAGGRDAGGAAGDPQRPGAGRTTRAEAIGNETSARLPRRTVSAGGVDLYA